MNKKYIFGLLFIFIKVGCSSADLYESTYYLAGGKKLAGRPIDLLDPHHPDHGKQILIAINSKIEVDSDAALERKELERHSKKYAEEHKK